MSPLTMATAYFAQFQKDFSLFLRSRSAEVVSGGRMVLAMLGRRTQDHADKRTSFLWELLAQSFAIMVSQEIVEQEQVDAYSVPFYAPRWRKSMTKYAEKGLSPLIRYKHLRWMSNMEGSSQWQLELSRSMICHHFGGEIVDTLFQIYTELLTESMGTEAAKSVQICVVLKRK